MKVLLSPAKAIDMTKRLGTEEVHQPMFTTEAEGLMK